MRRCRTTRLRSKTERQLVRMALRDRDEDRRWRAVAELHRRACPQTVAVAQELTRSANWRRRVLGLDIAAQLRRGQPDGESVGAPYALLCAQGLLLAGLEDAHLQVQAAALAGLGHRPLADALPRLLDFAEHPSAELRWHLTVTLDSYPQPASISALLRLAQDADARVRDWATFGLGSLHDADTPAIRDLLARNLGDPDSNVRAEAVAGLVRRGDPRAAEYLLTHLNDDSGTLDFRMAEQLAEPALLPALRALVADADGPDVNPDWRDALQAALAACDTGAARGQDSAEGGIAG